MFTFPRGTHFAYWSMTSAGMAFLGSVRGLEATLLYA